MSGYWQNLEARNYVPGGTVSFSMDGLPPGTRIRALQFSFELVGTKAAADVLPGDQFAKLVSNIKLGSFFNLGGMDLTRLLWAMDGHVVEDPNVYYSITQTNYPGTTFSLYMTLTIPLRDGRTGASDDGSLPSELLASRGAELTLANANVWNVGSLTITGGLIRCAVERIHETNVPFLARYGYLDASSQTIRLEPGLYKEIIITKADGSLVLPTDIGVVDLIADGRPILQAMRYNQLLTAWNRTACRNGAAGGRSELSQVGVPFLPLMWHDNTGQSRLTKQLLAEKDVLLQITSGSLLNPRIVYWRGVAKDKETITATAKAIGAPADATTYEPAVASKTPPHTDHTVQSNGRHSKKHTAIYTYLPGKFRSGPTPGNKVGGG